MDEDRKFIEFDIESIDIESDTPAERGKRMHEALMSIDYSELERVAEASARAAEEVKRIQRAARAALPLAGLAAASLSALAAAQSGSPELGRRMRAAVAPLKQYARPTKGKTGGKRRRKNRK